MFGKRWDASTRRAKFAVVRAPLLPVCEWVKAWNVTDDVAMTGGTDMNEDDQPTPMRSLDPRNFEFIITHSPPTYERAKDGPVVARAVIAKNVVVGIAWASVDGRSADFIEHEEVGPLASNTAVAIVIKFRAAYDRGIDSVEALSGLADEDIQITLPREYSTVAEIPPASRVKLGNDPAGAE